MRMLSEDLWFWVVRLVVEDGFLLCVVGWWCDGW